MSDDTPTERFPTPDGQSTEPLPAAPGSEPAATEPVVSEPAPTEVLRPAAAIPPASPAPAAYSATSSTPPPAGPGQSRGLLYALIGVGAALLIAIIIVVIMLLGRGGDDPVVAPSASPSASDSPSASPSPSPSASPSEEPEPEPEPAPPPAVVGPTFDSFTATPSAGCAEGDSSKPLSFSWSSGNAQSAYIGVATTNAKSAPYEGGLPVVYTYTNLSYQCSEASQVYTVTLEDADGNLAHKTVTISR